MPNFTCDCNDSSNESNVDCYTIHLNSNDNKPSEENYFAKKFINVDNCNSLITNCFILPNRSNVQVNFDQSILFFCFY